MRQIDQLIPVFLDFETRVSKTLTLRKLSLVQYLAGLGPSHDGVLGFSAAVGDEDPVFFSPDDGYEWAQAVVYLRDLFARPDHCVVAHNFSFDARVATTKLGCPWPGVGFCTIEAAMCAWPNQPGGYSLKNLANTLRLPSGKKTGDGATVTSMSPAELADYCRQDTRLCRDIFNLCKQRIPDSEWAVGAMCAQAKAVQFEVDPAAVDRAAEGLAAQAKAAAEILTQVLDDADGAAVGRDADGSVRSVKPHEVKRLLLENLGFDTHTISQKKINQVRLAAHDEAKAAVKAAADANKAMSHQRRVRPFHGAERVDAELNWYAAHTGRFASRAVGKGLNLLNMPKHDKDIAKLFRTMFRLPSSHCFVRADEMNVEYRVTCLLTQALAGINLFRRDVYADPYSNFGMLVMGRPITKADLIRQFFKMAILGLGYGMGGELWCRGILQALAKPKPDFTIATLRETCELQRWTMPKGRFASGLVTKLGCDQHVVIAGLRTRELFHQHHPEFKQSATWLMQACELASRGGGQAAIDDHYHAPGAMKPEYAKLEVTDDFEGVSLRVWCPAAGWDYPAVVWRDLAVREIPQRGVCLSIMSGARGYRAMSPSIAIENLVQAVSRQRTVMAKLALANRGYSPIFNVHDEILPVVPRTVDDVLRVKADLLDILGPHTRDDWGWAVAINPDEINVSQSWYEVDVGKLDPRFTTSAAWWAALPSTPSLLENLP